jgi:hypothetical protein
VLTFSSDTDIDADKVCEGSTGGVLRPQGQGLLRSGYSTGVGHIG